MIIGGDFNLPDIDWDDTSVRSSPQYGNEVNQLLIDFCNEFSLKQLVSEPTRGRNTLDLMFVSFPDLVNSVSVKSGIGDHESVITDLTVI